VAEVALRPPPRARTACGSSWGTARAAWTRCGARAELIDPLLAPLDVSRAVDVEGERIVEPERAFDDTGHALPATSGLEGAFIKGGERLVSSNRGTTRTITVTPPLPPAEARRLYARLAIELARDPERWPVGLESEGTWTGRIAYPCRDAVVASATDDCIGVDAGPPCDSEDDCDDGNECTADTCPDGACRNTSISCDDSDKCTVDSCDPATGACQHDPKICDKGTPCTAGLTCDPATGECPPPVGCEMCSGSAAEPDFDGDFVGDELTSVEDGSCSVKGGTIGIRNVGFSIPCGPFGTIGFNGDASLYGEGETCPCPLCYDQISVGGRASGYGEFCGITMNCFDFSAEGSKKWEYCKRCNDATCMEECQELKQTTTKGEVKGQVCFEGFIPGLKIGGNLRLGRLFSLDLNCGAKAKAKIGGNGSMSVKEAAGTKPDCLGENCTNIKGGVSAGAGVYGNCEFLVCVWNWCTTFNLENLVYGKVEGNGSLTRQWGGAAPACPTDTCFTGSVAAEAGADPTVKFCVRGWCFCVHAKAGVRFTCWKNWCNASWDCRTSWILEAGTCPYNR
jgi:hypothetical protein